MPKFFPYTVVRTSHKEKDSVVVVFRDTELSDKIGFVYQCWAGSDLLRKVFGAVVGK